MSRLSAPETTLLIAPSHHAALAENGCKFYVHCSYYSTVGASQLKLWCRNSFCHKKWGEIFERCSVGDNAAVLLC